MTPSSSAAARPAWPSAACLTALGCDHLIIERGGTAERWHSERWDSLRLLTPNWMTRLPAWSYDGPDPDGFMTAPEVASFLARYAGSFAAPVLEHTTLQHVTTAADGFVVTTSNGPFRSDNVVIATGWCDRPAIPAMGRHLSGRIHQVVPAGYRNPDDVAPGGVLVVGASATGVQLADELHRSGHPVTLAVGSHSRMPRRYRAWTSFGGSISSGRSTRPSTTSARWLLPETSRRCNWWAATIAALSTSPPCRPTASASSAD